jgi:uncharacterized protein DUF6580
MFVYFIILFAILTRFIPHIPNFVPITALAIFAAAYLPKKQAIAIPLLARFVSDIFLGFFGWKLMLAVYASHLVGVLLGLWIKNSKGSTRWLKIGTSGLLASVLFFLVTNFALFYDPSQYAHSFQGIILAYINGLPFLRGTLLADIGYTFALFGSYEVVRSWRDKRAPLALKKA